MSHRENAPIWVVLLSLLVAAGGWLYLQRVLVPHQISEAVVSGRPRGNLSDLYPRWLGARELLLHGRDPYSREISSEIQLGYYGRALDPNRAADPKDQQAFVYPLYVVFYLAPTIHAPFAAVQRIFFWTLVGLTVLSVPIWLRALQWSLPVSAQVSIAALTLGSLGTMQGLKLQQLSLVVIPLVAVGVLLLISGRQFAAGVVLALATIKPQLLWLLLTSLLIWTSGDWRRRWRWLAGFAAAMLLLSGGAMLLLPGWIPEFFHAMAEYRRYTGGMAVVQELAPSPWSWVLESVALIATLYTVWRARVHEASSDEFARMLCIVLAVTIFILPAFAPYNQLMLLPAILLALRERRPIWSQDRAIRVIFVLTFGLLVWPWIATTVLSTLSFVMPEIQVDRYWPIPFWTSLAIPVAVVALMLFYRYRAGVSSSAAHGTS